MASGDAPTSRRYLVERYLPRRPEGRIADDLRLLRQAVARLTHQNAPIRCVTSLFIPADETCFHVFEACGAEAVERVLRDAGLEHERLSEAVELDPTPSDAESPPRSSP